MIIDLIHNKIVADTISTGFEKSVEEKLVPALTEKYGDTEIVGIQMYEDYISDNFMKNGYWYYPLTVITADGCSIEWVKWAVNEESFERGVPYSYVGDGTIDFKLTDSVPDEFLDKLVGRACFCEAGLIDLRVETTATDITKLSGKYSQTFIDELARQITLAIGTAMSVEGLADGNLELSLVFASGTYMEHISENVTYRRLTLSDKGSAPRDFWIKWTRLDGAVAYSVSDNVGPENIVFELGEDVSQKIREKEYRYLVESGKDKYHNAMGRKNVTEWREIIKRAVRRGELVKIENTVELAPETRELEEKLADILGRAGVSVREEANAPEVVASPTSDDEFERAMQKMREMTDRESADDEDLAPVIPTEEHVSEACEDDAEEAVEAAPSEDEADEEIAEDEVEEETVQTEDAVSDEIVFSAADDADDGDDTVASAAQVEFFEEEEEDEEELDELEALYADDDAALEISEGAVPANDEEAAELEEMTRLAMAALAEVRARAAAENAVEIEEEQGDGEFEDFADEDALADEDEDALSEAGDEEALAELRMLEPDEDEDALPEVAEADASAVAEAPVAAPEITVTADYTVPPEREQDIRAEIEARIRLEYESRARKMAEEETARLRREQEAMRAENERLLAEAKREQEKIRTEYEKLLAETQRINSEREAREAVRRAEEEKLRAQIEAQLRQEARERERLAEAARMAIEEQRRLEEENSRREIQRAEEERRIEAERLQREAEARIVAEREAEAERIRREEEERRAAAAAAMPTVGDGKYSYTSKTVRFLFRRSVDPNITARIHEIIKATIEYYGKDKVFLKIRASVPDSQTVNLEFVQIPIEEMELLGNIIKILGNSGLGIAKAIVE